MGGRGFEPLRIMSFLWKFQILLLICGVLTQICGLDQRNVWMVPRLGETEGGCRTRVRLHFKENKDMWPHLTFSWIKLEAKFFLIMNYYSLDENNLSLSFLLVNCEYFKRFAISFYAHVKVSLLLKFGEAGSRFKIRKLNRRQSKYVMVWGRSIQPCEGSFWGVFFWLNF